jgi:hypothetical protein
MLLVSQGPPNFMLMYETRVDKLHNKHTTSPHTYRADGDRQFLVRAFMERGPVLSFLMQLRKHMELSM